MDWLLPRSTSSHCGSEKALDHRVPVLPSTALEAGKLALSVEEAVAVLPWAMLAVPQVAAAAGGAWASGTSAARISDAPASARPSRRRGGARGMGNGSWTSGTPDVGGPGQPGSGWSGLVQDLFNGVT